MKKLLCLFAACVGCVCVAGLPFLPNVDAPPPVETVYPANWATNLLLVTEAARICSLQTNMADMAQCDRAALLGYWVSVCRTNGTLEGM